MRSHDSSGVPAVSLTHPYRPTLQVKSDRARARLARHRL